MQRQQSEPSRSSPKCLQQESIRHGQRWQCMALSSPDCDAKSTTALFSNASYLILGPAPQKGRAPPQQQPPQQHALKGGLSRSKWAGHRHHRIFVHIRVAKSTALAGMNRNMLSHIPQPFSTPPYGRFKASLFESTETNLCRACGKRRAPS